MLQQSISMQGMTSTMTSCQKSSSLPFPMMAVHLQLQTLGKPASCLLLLAMWPGFRSWRSPTMLQLFQQSSGLTMSSFCLRNPQAEDAGIANIAVDARHVVKRMRQPVDGAANATKELFARMDNSTGKKATHGTAFMLTFAKHTSVLALQLHHSNHHSKLGSWNDNWTWSEQITVGNNCVAAALAMVQRASQKFLGPKSIYF